MRKQDCSLKGTNINIKKTKKNKKKTKKTKTKTRHTLTERRRPHGDIDKEIFMKLAVTSSLSVTAAILEKVVSYRLHLIRKK
jgi:hypothetical protein